MTDPAVPPPFVIGFDDPAATPDIIGMKAARLAAISRAGFSVPPGFVITTMAFQRLSLKSGPEAAGAARLPKEFVEEIEAAAARFGDRPLAVRSSSTAEDLPDASYAGLYETVLDVRGREALLDAVRTCWASASAPRVGAYRAGTSTGPIAVLVQPMVDAVAAGVAFSADPIDGDRDTVLISAVRGVSDRLTTGSASADEWAIRGDRATCRRRVDGAIDARQALMIAELVRAVEADAGLPQDVEWAIDKDGAIVIVQARPITALPDRVIWEPPIQGGFVRDFRYGEWLGDPLTPLFATWGIERLDAVLWAGLTELTGLPAPRPTFVLVNGWYYASLGFFPSNPVRAFLRILRHPRMILVFGQSAPSLADPTIGWLERRWRTRIVPIHERTVEAARAALDQAGPADLVAIIDALLEDAGRYFVWITMLAGTGYKTEAPLAAFWRRHLDGRVEGNHQRLLVGLASPMPGRLRESDVTSLDWSHPTLGELALESHAPGQTRDPGADRLSAEQQARAVLSGSVCRLKEFERLLRRAQRAARLREEVVGSFTTGWPTLRVSLLRLGATLVAAGRIDIAEDIFFLERNQLTEALASGHGSASSGDLIGHVRTRRREWERRRRLTAPVRLGVMPAFWALGLRRVLDPITSSGGRSDIAEPLDGSTVLVRGMPASPGRVTAVARVIHGPDDFHRLSRGEVLVAPATTPAWTVLFATAAAVVTDTGSPMAHASLVAREFGIPAIVGTENGTSSIPDGALVVIDGTHGLIQLVDALP